MEVDAQGYGREPTAMVRGVLSCLFVCLFPNPKKNPIAIMRMKMGEGMKKELKKVGGRPMTGRLRVGK